MLKSLIVAISENGVIGNNGDIPWKLPQDMKHFSRTTKNKVVIMGRHTWFSLPEKFRPLPHRTNIIVSAKLVDDKDDMPDGTVLVTNLKDAWQIAESLGVDEAVVIGGVRLYEEALPQVDRIYLTRVEASYEGDAKFDIPNDLLQKDFTGKILQIGTEDTLSFNIVEYNKKK